MGKIPDTEFKERVLKVQGEVEKRDLDAIIVHSNEADFANVRYLSDYWPLFESAGVIVPRQGSPILLIGPESETFARDRSKIKEIRKILEYRESAEPEYPDIPIDSFESVFAEINNGQGVKRLGIVGYSIMPLPVWDGICRALPGAQIVRADDILTNLRIIKSPNEIELLREAFRISEKAIEAVLERIRPGMTEQEVVGIAQEVMYANGAEYEAHPTYVLSGINTTHAIGRPKPKKINAGEMIQLNIGARVEGYSPSVGRPICIGKMPREMRRLVEVGLEAHRKTMEWIKAGVVAGEVVEKYFDFVRSRGCGANLLYGPCHGLGMMEVERPWMESTSKYLLEENMTFQVDTFLYTKDYGLRWEDGIRVTKDGVEELSNKRQEIIEL